MIVTDHQPRAYGLDLLRAILILIGIPYHTGLLLGDMTWVYNSINHKSIIIPLLSEISHFFRMQVFFFISGYFCHLVVEKKGGDFFWKSRINKVLVPLLTATLLVTLPQAWLIYHVSSDHHVGSVVSHLWFLYCLFFISALVLYLHLKINQLLKKQISLFVVTGGIIMLAYVCAVLTRSIPVSLPLQIREYLKLPVMSLYFFPYFILGYALKEGAAWAKRLLSFPVLPMLIIFIIMAGCYITFENIPYFKLVKPLLETLLPLSAIPVIFNVFLWEGFKRSPMVEFITDSALVVYIFHHPFIIIYGYLLDPKEITAWSYYLSVIGLSVASSVVLYLILRKMPLAKKAFGIKK
ncbi:acyltransferase family protein [Enterobacteriaceae bacterium LUAb1]